jgi:diguanylate cyclase (GGDEF)-like protein
MSAVAAMATCLGGWTLTQMVLEYGLAGRVERAVDIDALLFVASDKIGLERPVVGDALLEDGPADADVRARLAVIRKDTDSTLAHLESRIAEVSYPGAAGQLAVVQKTRADLATWRTNVDATLSHPRSERDPNIFAHYIASLNAVFDATSVALDIGDLAASQHDGTSVELMTLARHVWAVRATMGVRTVPLMAAIDTRVPLDRDQLEAQTQFDGILSANWTPIMALSRRLSGVPGLAVTIAAAREAAEAYDRLCHQVIAAGRTSAVYPISALDLGRTVVRTAPVLLKIRDEALAAARARVSESRHSALAHVVTAAVVLGLTVVAMIVVLTLLQRRIVSPVLALTDVIGRIARLDFDVPIPARNRMDEIGRMAVALDALRSGAMAGEANKAQIVHLARHDALTGLPNRRELEERLEHAVAMGGRGHLSAVLCLDLDRFKAVNDTFGHPTGDRLLQAVAERLLACVRDVDTVSRLGGDEFVVLLAGLDQPDHSAVVAARIVRLLNEPFDLASQVVSIGCSVGIAITPQDATSAIVLLKCADTALYRAKAEEKGSWRFFKPEMDAHLQERMGLERDLRDAVQHDGFALAYQPLYKLAPDRHGTDRHGTDHLETDRLCGFEALLRWRHPVRGMIGPAAFIPIAEETGLIVPIGAWVLRQACAEAMHWPNDVKLSVNLSGVQFKNAALVQTVRDALAAAGLPAVRLELEITETVLLNNSAGSLAMLHELHDMGIQIAMDDFGTGYSSLSYLRSFPFDKIKIDQSFIRDLSDHADSRAIVRAVVALAGSLGMTTTAEGVETADQLSHVRREGCTDVQGYFFSKPVPAAEARLLARGEAAEGVGVGRVGGEVAGV